MVGLTMERNEEASNDSRTCAFSCTAGIRESRRFFSLVSRHNVSRDSEDDPLVSLEEFLKQTWNIWGVSVLFDFITNDQVQLKKYAKKLREEVACILSQEDVSYEAKIDILDLQRPKETDHPIVKIEVFAQVTGQEDREKCVYKGYLLSWRTESTEPALTESSARLPLLLCRGTASTMRAVHQTLGRMFDCLFVPLPASHEDLMWLLLIAISPGGGQDSAKKTDEALLQYTVPGLPSSDVIAIKFNVQQLINLWEKFLDDKDDKTTIDVEEVEKFHDVLQKQIMEITDVQLGLCILHRIHLPSVTISENKMKIMNVETMNTVLTYLNEKALDALHLNMAQLNISK